VCRRFDAFFRGYDVIVPKDAVEAISEEDHESGLKVRERAAAGTDRPLAGAAR